MTDANSDAPEGASEAVPEPQTPIDWISRGPNFLGQHVVRAGQIAANFPPRAASDPNVRIHSQSELIGPIRLDFEITEDLALTISGSVSLKELPLEQREHADKFLAVVIDDGSSEQLWWLLFSSRKDEELLARLTFPVASASISIYSGGLLLDGEELIDAPVESLVRSLSGMYRNRIGQAAWHRLAETLPADSPIRTALRLHRTPQ